MAKSQTKPPWLKIRLQHGPKYEELVGLTDELQIHTVCREARCPNIYECWNAGTATFMILGDVCTRSCGFCAVQFGLPNELDLQEPQRVAQAVAQLGLHHVVITSVARDDLADGGAAIFAATVQAVQQKNPQTTVEVLVPDFSGSNESIDLVLAAGPAVFNHNLETVRRLSPRVRSRARYDRSLAVLRRAAHWAAAQPSAATAAAHWDSERGKRPPVVIKSGLMLGLGEEPAEVATAMSDLRAAGCQVLTIGQYLQPSPQHLPVERYVTPAEFEAYRRQALDLGFTHVEAGPLVRSSYRAWHHLAAVQRPVGS